MSRKRGLHSQTFSYKYSKEFDFILRSSKSETYAYCSLCNCDISISHSGRADIVKHAKTTKHMKNSKCGDSSSRSLINQYLTSDEGITNTRAEVLFTVFMLEHNLPFSVADHARPLLRAMFPNNEEVKKFSCGRTKATYIAKELASDGRSKIIAAAKEFPFTVSTDGSHSGGDQLYPVVLTMFQISEDAVKPVLLSLPKLIGPSTGENIANLIVKQFAQYDVPWENCVALSCDNAPVMIGRNNGVAAFLKIKQPNLFVFGCMCHLLNLAAQKSAEMLPVSFNELLIDVYYYLEKSFKRKSALKEVQEFCEEEIQPILKHGCTRWLSIGRCLARLLQQWRCLTIFFKNECKSTKKKGTSSSTITVKSIMKNKITKKTSTGSTNSKHKQCKKDCSAVHEDIGSSKTIGKLVQEKLTKEQSSRKILNKQEHIFLVFSSELNHAYALFVQHVIKVYESFNCLFQEEEPRVHTMKSDIGALLNELLVKFVCVTVLKQASSVFDVNYSDVKNQKRDEEISIGSNTMEVVKELSSEQQKEFFVNVKKYFIRGCNYIISSFPWDSNILEWAQVANVSKRGDAKFSYVRHLVETFPCLLSRKSDESFSEALDALEDEFLKFQVAELPEPVLSTRRITEQWSLLSKEKDFLGKLLYYRLSTFMLGVLTLPHSNASCERVFSTVRKVKTETRGRLSSNTLESVLISKCISSQPCYKQQFSNEFLKKAKSSTSVGLAS